MKKISLELGGNAPFIVFADADLDAAVAGAIASKYRNTGQTCVCANRLLVQAPVYEAFTQKLVRAVAQLRVGDGLKGATDQGPLIDDKALAKVEEHLADALARARASCRAASGTHSGARSSSPRCSPTSPRRCWWRARRPSAPSHRCFASRARPTPSAWPTTPSSASRPTSTRATWRAPGGWPRRSSTASSGLNTGLISTEVAPFGGVKESGTGREGSKYGILDYTELKYLCVGIG